MDDINAQQLARCGGERIVFAAQDVGSSEALAACLVHTGCAQKIPLMKPMSCWESGI